MGCATIAATIQRLPGRLVVTLDPESRRAGGAVPKVDLAPSLPLGATVTAVTVDGAAARYTVEPSPHDVAARLQVPVDRPRRIEFRYEGGAEILPLAHRALPGDPAGGFRVLDWRREGPRYVATVEGVPGAEYSLRVRTTLPLAAEGGRVTRKDGEFLTIAVRLSGSGDRPVRQRMVLTP